MNQQKQPLQQAIQEHFEQQQLSDEQFRTLVGPLAGLSANNAPTDDATTSPPQPARRLWLQWAVAAILLMCSGGLLWHYWQKMTTRQSLISAITKEIAKNHHKQSKSTLMSADISRLQKHLPELQFTLIISKFLPAHTWTLLGGKYCSVQGKLAAQLKFQHRRTKAVYTLYQTPIIANLQHLRTPIIRHKRGTTVKLWHERGLLLGIAGP